MKPKNCIVCFVIFLITGFVFFSCSDQQSTPLPSSPEFQNVQGKRIILRDPTNRIDAEWDWAIFYNLDGWDDGWPYSRDNSISFRIYEDGTYKTTVWIVNNIDIGTIVYDSPYNRLLYEGPPNGGSLTNFKVVVVETCTEYWFGTLFNDYTRIAGYVNISEVTGPYDSGVYGVTGGSQIAFAFYLRGGDM